MKIKGEIIGVETTGESLRVDVQGKSLGAADWRPLARQTVVIPQTDAAGKTFYVGRKVTITIEPQ